MSYYLAIVGRQDTPLYELEFGTSRQGGDGKSRLDPQISEVCPFVAHAALDVVDDVQWTTPQLYLKAVDNFYGYTISAFVTAGHVRILLLHDTKHEDAIRQFFVEVYDLYVKTLMSPFYQGGEIRSSAFNSKVQSLGRKHL